VPVSYSREANGTLVVIAATGPVTPREFIQLANAVVADPQVQGGAQMGRVEGRTLDRLCEPPKVQPGELLESVTGERMREGATPGEAERPER
jgi:hypothetical protein